MIAVAVIALVVFALFVVLAGGVRVWLQYRYTGDTGIRSVRPGSGLWAVLATVVGSGAVGVLAPLGELAGWAPLSFLDVPSLRFAGVILAGVGVLGAFVAQLAMGTYWRIGVDPTERTTLLTDGLFRVVRNPIYAAWGLMGLGLALAVPNLIAVVGLAVLVAGIELVVRVVEEPYLHRQHGFAYERYAAQVGRFVPGVGRLHRGGLPR
ncbi:MAG: isoprenylcysteine carboxylmethyltransferase family protein [Streptosporangiales bacterium]|nr:isoprenylcysteine carboxylmethyltransferase family protein [Streptosporangiales bacterium]